MKKTNTRNEWKDHKRTVLDRIGDFSFAFKNLGKQKATTGGWVSACCPFHEDRNPSFQFHSETGRWNCFTGCGEGDIFEFLTRRTGQDFKTILRDLGERAGVEPPATSKPPPPDLEKRVRVWADNLWLRHDRVRWLCDHRRLTDETIRKYDIGWDDGRKRYTIPIRDENRQVVNVRLYSANAKSKIINYTEGGKKYGSPPRLFGLDELVTSDGSQIIICEGEWDRLLLRQHGFLAVTGTHGATTFRPEWIEYFAGRDVVILYDCDEPGKAAACTVVIPAMATSKAKSVRNVVLPLSGGAEDNDVTDFFVRANGTADNLQRFIDDTVPHSYEEQESPVEIIDLESFTEIDREDLVDRMVRCEMTIIGETSGTFSVPESYRITHCEQMSKGNCYECGSIRERIEIPPQSHIFIGSCMSSDAQVRSMLQGHACPRGKKPGIEILSRTTVNEVYCHQKTSRATFEQDEAGNVIHLVGGKRQEMIEKRVYINSSDHFRPGSYSATGWVKSHPKTQEVSLLVDSIVHLEEDFECFSTRDNIENLKAFRALSLEEILADLTDNVTKIYDRHDILLAALLTYCSPRWLPFNGDHIRGWVIATIIGDSGTGKTQTFQRIADFTNIGDCFSALTGSRTGLAYSLSEQANRGWQVKVGRYPANTRKILAVDEAQRLQDGELRTLSKAMEEGFMQIDRVRSQGYESQTRLIMAANPKNDRIMDSFSYGCEALSSIFPPTIIRRIDVAVFANSGDLDGSVNINHRRSPDRPRKITAEMLRSVIYWAWNLNPSQIAFSVEAEERCFKSAEYLAGRYGDATDLPLAPASDTRNKLARIAAAFAVIRLSADDDFAGLHVEEEHVRMATDYLDGLYSEENCGLDEHSRIMRGRNHLEESEYKRIAKSFLDKKEMGKHASGNENAFPRLIQILRNKKAIRGDELSDLADCSYETVKRQVKLLKIHDLIDSTRKGYEKTPKFVKFLRRFEKEHTEFFEDTKQGSGFN